MKVRRADRGPMRILKTAYRRARLALRCAFGRDVRFRVQVRVPTERHGSDYGGWWVCPDGITARSLVYSLGIGHDITFDLSLIDRFGAEVHGFDPTPASLDYLSTLELPDRYRYHPVGVGAHDGPAMFFAPENPEHVSHSLLAPTRGQRAGIQVEIRRLSTVMGDLGHHRIDVLKMDIEGAEYGVLDEILERRLPVRQILVEFHHRFAGVGPERTRRAVEALNAAGYRIFAVSASGEEYSFIADDVAVPPGPGLLRYTGAGRAGMSHRP